MPYHSTNDLPASVKENLPPHAKKIYQEAFNHAWKLYKNPAKRKGTSTQEEVAHKVAWNAVKKKYHKDPSRNQWVANSE